MALLAGCEEIVSPPEAISRITGECPAPVAAELGSYPMTFYVTLVLDGRIVSANRRQVVRGPHDAEDVDPRPSPLDHLYPTDIESIELLMGPAPEALGVCPGVHAIVIVTKG